MKIIPETWDNLAAHCTLFSKVMNTRERVSVSLQALSSWWFLREIQHRWESLFECFSSSTHLKWRPRTPQPHLLPLHFWLPLLPVPSLQSLPELGLFTKPGLPHELAKAQWSTPTCGRMVKWNAHRSWCHSGPIAKPLTLLFPPPPPQQLHTITRISPSG